MKIQSWTMEYDTYEPLPCQAPCTMYSVLLEHGKIPDPFYGTNERELQHLAEKGCAFTAVFTPEAGLLSKDHVELTFHGLDTICTITLNGHRLGRVKNMHRTYVFPVKDLLLPGENTLRLDFAAPIPYFTREQQKHYLYMNNGDTIPGTAHLRKAMYQSGWDWGPTLPDMGIFREVELSGYDTDRLKDILVSQRHENGVVSVDLRISTAHNAGCEIYASLDGKRVRLTDGEGTVTVENPRLWWVRGYGDQPLYDLTVELVKDGQVIDTALRRIGLRTLTVSTAKDADGKGSEFCFVCNGVKIFSMGANYVPMDNLLSRVTSERLDTLIAQAVDGGFNTLRVWGGGYYPEDHFYDLCDQYGILVWQDFMVACANIWLTDEMEAEFTQESADNLSRLQHHPSLGLLCGNNEMELMILDGAQNTELVRHDYLHLYEHLLPQQCRKYAPDTFYWSSSPSSGGGFEDPGSHSRGDVHYWTVWHGLAPMTSYRDLHVRFCSEYGFESFPSMKTIRSFCAEEDLNCFSRVMDNHQKCKGGSAKLLWYLSEQYLYPSAFENLVYASQLLQADAIRYAVEHFRRERGYCMGSTYWQFNDCWPVASWASVDSCGRYKALHYAARKFYAPIAMGLFLENGALTVNVSNETMSDFRGRVVLSLKKSDFTVLDQVTQPASLAALTSRDVLCYPVSVENPYDVFLCAELYNEEGALVARGTETLVPPKHFTWKKPHITAQLRDITDGVEIQLTSDVFAAGVYLDFRDFDLVLSDNFFPLTDGEPYRITAKTSRSARELEENLEIKTVYDIR